LYNINSASHVSFSTNKFSVQHNLYLTTVTCCGFYKPSSGCTNQWTQTKTSFHYYQKISQHSHSECWFIPTQFTSLQNVHQKDVELKHAHNISASFFHAGLWTVLPIY